MVTTEMRKNAVETGGAAGKLAPQIEKELAELVEEAELNQTKPESPPAHWFYTTPCAGVRYYSYDPPYRARKSAR